METCSVLSAELISKLRELRKDFVAASYKLSIIKVLLRRLRRRDYRVMSGSSVRFGQEPCLHIVERLDVSGSLESASNLSNEDREQMATITDIVKVSKGVVHPKPQGCSLVSLHHQSKPYFSDKIARPVRAIVRRS